MTLDEFIKTWGGALTLLSTSGTLLLGLLSRTYAKRDDFIKMKSDMESLEKRVNQMPTHEEVLALRLEISEARGEMKELSADLKSIRHISDLLLENRLNEK